VTEPGVLLRAGLSGVETTTPGWLARRAAISFRGFD
jgi:hypothetical protein